RAFTETKDRKAATSGFTVTLDLSAGPFSGALTASIRNLTLAKPGGDVVETTGRFGAALSGKVPAGAIFGSPAQMGAQIAVWLAQLAPKIERIKQVIADKNRQRMDIMKAVTSLKEQLRAATEMADAAIEGTWREKAAEFAKAAENPGLLTSSKGVTLGLSYSADKDGNGTGT